MGTEFRAYEGRRASILNRCIDYQDYYCYKSPANEGVCLSILYLGRLCPHISVRPPLTTLFKWQPSPLPILPMPHPSLSPPTLLCNLLIWFVICSLGESEGGGPAHFVHCRMPSARDRAWSTVGTGIYLLTDEVASLGFSVALVAVNSPTWWPGDDLGWGSP